MPAEAWKTAPPFANEELEMRNESASGVRYRVADFKPAGGLVIE
jgi:hypothetical protein